MTYRLSVAPLEDIVAQVRKQPRDAFARVHRCSFLLQRLDDPRAPEHSADVLPVTTTSSRSHPDDLAVLARCRFVAILKSGENPFADRIRLGRGSEADILLDHPSLSQLHAHFFLRDDATYVSDAASRHGTRIGGVRLTRADRVRLAVFDVITFGDLPMTFLGAAELHDFLRGLAVR